MRFGYENLEKIDTKAKARDAAQLEWLSGCLQKGNFITKMAIF